MKVGYERLNSDGYPEEVIDSDIDAMEDVDLRIEELKAEYADDDSVVSVFYARPVDETRYKIVYIESI